MDPIAPPTPPDSMVPPSTTAEIEPMARLWPISGSPLAVLTRQAERGKTGEQAAERKRQKPNEAHVDATLEGTSSVAPHSLKVAFKTVGAA